MAKAIKIERFSGVQLEKFISKLARLRIEVFRDFPYLYDGDNAYEEKYLKTYIECPESVMVLAFDNKKIIGASTAIPICYETEEVKQPFLDHDYNPDQVFYCGESVLNNTYRGQGIGVRFLKNEKHMPNN